MSEKVEDIKMITDMKEMKELRRAERRRKRDSKRNSQKRNSLTTRSLAFVKPDNSFHLYGIFLKIYFEYSKTVCRWGRNHCSWCESRKTFETSGSFRTRSNACKNEFFSKRKRTDKYDNIYLKTKFFFLYDICYIFCTSQSFLSCIFLAKAGDLSNGQWVFEKSSGQPGLVSWKLKRNLFKNIFSDFGNVSGIWYDFLHSFHAIHRKHPRTISRR